MNRIALLLALVSSSVLLTACPNTPQCGDNIVDANEECDDGNLNDGDGCSASCTEEIPDPFCGDGNVDQGEECDDGNTASEDGCSDACLTEFCGDGVIQAALGEVCDAGDQNSDIVADACRTTCLPAGCGDSVIDTGEVCDDGNLVDGDGCNAQCFAEGCGDGIVQAGLGEQCDDGGANSDTQPDACRTTCLNPICGDTVTDTGEECDDGNAQTNDGCTPACIAEVCGDGIIQAPLGEGCDDGNTADNDGCSSVCAVESCGDGIQQASEECDDGNVANNDGCSSGCLQEFCGDGRVQVPLGEECDDGGIVNGDGCSATCTVEICGDGIVQAALGEQCDDGNVVSEDGCSNTCVVERCGDGTTQVGLGEQCDDGNIVNEDGCDSTCIVERCGDGIRQVGLGEECDNGAANSNNTADACRLDCSDAACGDNVVDTGEACDDGNTLPEDGCSGVCNIEICGDGTTQVALGEQCDDGNTISGDGCDAGCQLELCGNNVLDPGEQCDDGNTAPGDGCGATCRTEGCGDNVVQPALGEQCDNGAANSDTAPDACRTTCLNASCGDNVSDTGEACDDGNNTDGDGCTATCVVEFCGDAAVNNSGTEQCDDGNNFDEDGCSAACLNEFCGDNVTQVGLGEQCDDGNVVSGDGCTNGCVVEFCGDGTVQPGLGETCDDGNNTNGDGCDAFCVPEAGCGDNIIQAGEQCDDGNTVSEDGCSDTCRNEFCGDNVIQVGLGESCDDGNTAALDGCNDLCGFEFCGDGVIQAGFNEVCDDGNNFRGDGCNSACQPETCGDGVVSVGAGEECDDGNTAPGDGCDDLCLRECTPDAYEDNDDETTATDLDAIGFPAVVDASLCGADVSPVYGFVMDWYSVTVPAGGAIEAFIGDGATTTCADQDLRLQLYDSAVAFVDGSGSNPWFCPELRVSGLAAGTYYILVWQDPAPNGQDYQLTVDAGAPTCGNGVIEVAETCDDSNTTPGDGCDAACQSECADDIYEDNDDFATAFDTTGLPNPSTLNGVICDSDTSPTFTIRGDAFRVNIPAGQQLHAAIGDGATTTCSAQGLYLQFYEEQDPADPNAATFVGGAISDGVNCPEIFIDASVDAAGFVLVWAPPGTPTQDYTLTLDIAARVCGDGTVDADEGCDDGNTVGGDGCSSFCSVEACGNGFVEAGAGEWCDDGNTAAGDGCDDLCQVEVSSCLDGDGDGEADAACGGTDCNDANPAVNTAAAEIPGDGVDNDCDGVDELALCAVTGPRNTLQATGTLTCGDTTSTIDFDEFLVTVNPGDCVDIHVDNDAAGAADLFAYAQDANGLSIYGFEFTNYSQLDDEWACTTSPWSPFGCPSASVTAVTAGDMLISVGQWNGGCADNAGYSLFVAINGTPVAPTQVGDDTPYF